VCKEYWFRASLIEPLEKKRDKSIHKKCFFVTDTVVFGLSLVISVAYNFIEISKIDLVSFLAALSFSSLVCTEAC
jgi:hypothetical protein